MAFLLPTIATKRANRSVARNLAGASAIFIARARSTSLRLVTIARRVAEFLPHGRGAAARASRSLIASPRPTRGTRRIERAQVRKEIGRGLDEVAAPRQVEHGRRALGARRRCRAEGEQGLLRLDAPSIKPQPRPRGVVGGQRARG